MAAMGRAARAEYEAKYTPERNYAMLIGIYERTLETYQRSPSRKRIRRHIKEAQCQVFSK